MRKHDCVHCAERMTDQYKRRLLACSAQRGMQFVGHHTGSSIAGAGIAPAEAGTVIRADARKRRYFRLHSVPIQISRAVSVLENYSWPALTSAIQVQAITAENRQLAGRTELLRVLLACPALVAQTQHRNDHQRCNFNRKHDSKRSRASSRELLVSAQPGKEEAGGENKRHTNAQHNCPPHRMKTGCDLSLPPRKDASG